MFEEKSVYKHKQRDLDTASKFDDVNLMIKDWELKGGVTTRTHIDNFSREQWYDLQDVRTTSVRVIGTRKQLYLLYCKKFDLEAWQIRDSYDIDWEEFPVEKQDYYKSLYKKNLREPVIILLK